MNPVIEFNSRLAERPLPRQRWSASWYLSEKGQGPVEWDLPKAAGGSCAVFDSESVAAWVKVGQRRLRFECRGRVLVMPEDSEGSCVLEGTFTRGLYAYVDPAALELAPSDAMWLVDFEFKMPGVVENARLARAFQRDRPVASDAPLINKEQQIWEERLRTGRMDT